MVDGSSGIRSASGSSIISSGSDNGKTCEKNIVQFDTTKHRSFSPATPVSSCSNTGPMRNGPYWTSKENSLGSW